MGEDLCGYEVRVKSWSRWVVFCVSVLCVGVRYLCELISFLFVVSFLWMVCVKNLFRCVEMLIFVMFVCIVFVMILFVMLEDLCSMSGMGRVWCSCWIRLRFREVV